MPVQIDLNHPDKLGNTSLHQAALFDQSVMIHMFLEKGASTTATNNIGEVRARTPVHIEAGTLTDSLSRVQTPIKVAQPFMQQKIQAYVESGAW